VDCGSPGPSPTHPKSRAAASHPFTLQRFNWNNEPGEFAVGVPIYYGDERKRKNNLKRLDASLALLAAANPGATFLLLDDGSPAPVDVDHFSPILGNVAWAYARQENRGAGGAYHALQVALSPCRYVANLDADVELDDPLALQHAAEGFDANPDAVIISSNITYFARMWFAQNPDGGRWVSGANSADFRLYKSILLGEVGYVDPEIRRLEDGEFRLRMEALHGLKVYVDRLITGKATPGMTDAARAEENVPMVLSRSPWAQATRRRDGRFLSLRLRAKAREQNWQDRYVGPAPYALALRDALWEA